MKNEARAYLLWREAHPFATSFTWNEVLDWLLMEISERDAYIQELKHKMRSMMPRFEAPLTRKNCRK